MKKSNATWLAVMCATATIIVSTLPVQAGLVTFDEPGYVAGSTPPSPWTDYYTTTGDPKSDLVYQVAAGAGVGGSQALTVYQNGYLEGAAVYILPTPLTSAGGAQRISVMLDPSQNDPYSYTSFGGISIGRGWIQNSSAVFRGVNFEKYGGNQPSNFRIGGPGGVFGYFTPSSAQNYYEIAFDINADFNSISITVTAPDSTIYTQTTSWGGGTIDKVWLWDGDSNYSGQPVYYDNLYAGIPEPATVCLLGLGALSLIRRKR